MCETAACIDVQNERGIYVELCLLAVCADARETIVPFGIFRDWTLLVQ